MKGRWLKIFVVLLAGNLASSCQTKDVVPGDEGENTYMSVVLDLSFTQPILTKNEDNQVYNPSGHWEGRDKVKGVDVYIVDNSSGKVHYKQATLTNTPDPNTNVDRIYHTIVFKTKVRASADIYVVVNNNGDIKAALDAAAASGKTAFENAYNASYDYSFSQYAYKEGSDHVILMTGAPLKNQAIKANISYGEATISGPVNPDKNQFAFSVRRSTAIVAVTKVSTLPDPADVGSGANFAGTITDLKWTYAQFEKKINLLWDASASITPTDANYHFTTKSPNWDYITTDDNYLPEVYVNRYEYTLLTEENLKPVLALSGSGINNIMAEGNPRFITETTHQHGPESTTNPIEELTGYRKGNTPYILIEGIFYPKPTLWATGERAKYDALPSPKHLYYNSYNGKFYASSADAIAAGVSPSITPGGDGIIKYTDSKMYYFAWLNPDDNDLSKVLNAPVVRNNIYHINILSFSKVGLSGNPYDPSGIHAFSIDIDDDLPKPCELLKITDTYMSTQITVADWGEHNYVIDL